jgi:hypothetical protein
MNSGDQIESDEPSEAQPCPICGGSRFTWGRTHFPLRFIPDGASFWSKVRESMGSQAARSRKCDSCGNLQVFDS